MKPGEGERRALVGYGGQFEIAARVLIPRLDALEWIRVADPAAGVADDFQYKTDAGHFALQVKWSQYPGSFTWSDLTTGSLGKPPLFGQLASAWKRLRERTSGRLTVELASNNFASSSPAAAGPLADVTADGPKSLAAFLERAMRPVQKRMVASGLSWAQVSDDDAVTEWVSVWAALLQSSGLSSDEFGLYLKDLRLSFGIQPIAQTIDLSLRGYEDDVHKLAGQLNALVRDPSWVVQVSRDELLEQLGWTGRLRYRYKHSFPIPTLYEANSDARDELTTRLATLGGGYVALVGPAGSGKSTLLQSLELEARVIRYYAFVPDAPDPLSGRGEADSFLHDLALALDRNGISRPGYGNDVAAKRTIVFSQLEQAGRDWSDHEEKTVIIIDGLDHIAREQNPSRSLLEELPPPAAIPDGVYLILGTQTVSVLPLEIRAGLATDERIVEVPPLADAQVRRLAELSGVTTWLLPGQVDRLVTASQGHPLALSYILESLSAAASNTAPDSQQTLAMVADRLLDEGSVYGGNVEQRYEGYFSLIRSDAEILDIVAMISRLRIEIDLDWLGTWIGAATVSRFASVTAPFFRREARRWKFVHNSFRRYLSDITATVDNQVDSAADRAFHSRLASLCANSSGEWLVYQNEEPLHRFLAGEYSQALTLCMPDIQRQRLSALTPLASVRDHALVGLRAATELEDVNATFSMLLFLRELGQREDVLSADALLRPLSRFAKPDLEMQHVVRANELRVSRPAAFRCASRLAADGYLEEARQIVKAADGLSGLLEEHRSRSQDTGLAVQDWAEAVWLYAGEDDFMAELEAGLSAHRRGALDAADQHDPWALDLDDIAYFESCALARCFDLTISVRNYEVSARILEQIDARGSLDWRARCRIVWAKAAFTDGSAERGVKIIEDVAELAELPFARSSSDEADDEEVTRAGAGSLLLRLRLDATETLIRAGHRLSPLIELLVPAGTQAVWPDPLNADGGLDPYLTVIGLLRVRAVCPDASKNELVSIRAARNPGDERFKRAVLSLAEIEGTALRAAAGLQEPPTVHALATDVIRVLEVPRSETRDWTGWYRVPDAAADMWSRLVTLAAASGGMVGLGRLLGKITRNWSEPDHRKYWSVKARQQVIAAALTSPLDASRWAQRQLALLANDITTESADADSRVLDWIRQSECWADAGNFEKALRALEHAVESSLGMGYSDSDDQMTVWVDWLAAARASNALNDDEFAQRCDDFAWRLIGLGLGSGGFADAAAESLIDALWPSNPKLAASLAEILCDQSVLSEDRAIGTIAIASTADTEVPAVVAAKVAAAMVLPLRRRTVDDASSRLALRADGVAATDLLRDAERVWVLEEATDNAAEDAVDASPDVRVPLGEGAPEGPQIVVPGSTQAFIAALKAIQSPSDVSPAWCLSACENLAGVITTRQIAQQLLAEAKRLRFSSPMIGILAALAARSGAEDLAIAALKDELAQMPPQGWLKFWDGGSRQKLFERALADGNPHLVALAVRDLSGALSAGAMRSGIGAADLLRICRLLGGDELVGSIWPEVSAYLDVLAPVPLDRTEIPNCYDAASTSLDVLLTWLVTYLGHPVRPLDFGARASLQVALSEAPEAAERALIVANDIGGWTCEAALLAYLTSNTIAEGFAPSTDLMLSLSNVAIGSDAILRDLANRILLKSGEQRAMTPFRELSRSYSLMLPRLPRRSTYEVDSSGMALLDPHDPRQTIAPYDLYATWLTKSVGVDREAILYHAASVANAQEDPWLSLGVRGQRDRLSRRGNRHGYRPWAYMAGRRAIGEVLADFMDAQLISGYGGDLCYGLGLLDETLVHMQPEPLPASAPLPFRSEGSRYMSVRQWCSEIGEAINAYAAGVRSADEFVLAEHSDWVSLEWELPREERRLRTMHGTTRAPLVLPVRKGWDLTDGGALGYASAQGDLRWEHEELIALGRELHSDARWMCWLALHPKVGAELGWLISTETQFEWVGTNGEWKARTVVAQRGLLDHEPPARVAAGLVWRVLLSRSGYEELSSRFGVLERTLRVRRSVPAGRDRPHSVDSEETVVV